MTHLREHWEGALLAGNYTLEKWSAGDESTALFEASLATGGRAQVKLVSKAAGDGALVDLWHRIRQLRHPNLIELLDFGSAEHGGEIVYYAVFESADETLASALSQSPLTSQESREVLDAALDALRYLHAQGLVLGALDADHVVAVGERIKLSTAAVREAETSATYREDVRLLGGLWHQALMAASTGSEEIAAHATDPNPQTRWTLAEIRGALTIAAVPSTAPAPAVPEPMPEQPIDASPISTPPAKVGTDARRIERLNRRTQVAVSAFRFPRWIVAGAGGFLLLIFALNRPWRADVASERVAPLPVTAEVPPAPLSKAPAPAASSPKAPAPAAAARIPSRPAGEEIWRVIAFTYRTREMAAKKVEQLNRDHPGLKASVFSPKSQRGYYLVSLGGRMTRDDALRLQRTARGKGLPRDLYVQNYSE